MENKNLNENSISAMYIPSGMTADEFERWLLNNGFTLKTTFHDVYDPITGNFISSNGHLWIRKNKKQDDKRNFYSTKEEPSLREILLHVGQQCGSREQPVTVEAYNTFARWDVWPGGFVENLDYVSIPAASVDYGCSIYTNSWIPRGQVENPVHVFQFYKLVEEEKWRGGEVSTWGNVSQATKILGSSLSMGFEAVSEGQETLGGLINIGKILGREQTIAGLSSTFSDCYNANTNKYEISDLKLRNYLQNAFYLKFVYGNNDLESVKDALAEHKAVLVRIVKNETPVGDIYGDDLVILDYNWLRQTFVCINPLNGHLTSVSELELMSGTPKALFYVLDKE